MEVIGMSGNKEKFTLVLTKEDAVFDGWDTPLSEAINQVDVIWTGVCTAEEADKKFYDLIKKQTYEYRELKTISKWRAVRLYDADGKLLAMES